MRFVAHHTNDIQDKGKATAANWSNSSNFTASTCHHQIHSPNQSSSPQQFHNREPFPATGYQAIYF